MSKKIVLLTSFLVFLLFAMVATSSAQLRIPGVYPGDWFEYDDIIAYWSSSDPNATCPEYLMEFNETEGYQMTVTDVSGTNITGQSIRRFKNGTEITSGGYVDVDTGDGENVTMWVISANLGVNDTLYASGDYSTWTINETIVRTYPDGVRETNHINQTAEQSMSNGYEIYYYSSANYYWDRSTGILVEMSMEFINQTGDYLTTLSVLLRITESNVWVVPEFFTLTSILLVFIVITTAIGIYKRRILKALIH